MCGPLEWAGKERERIKEREKGEPYTRIPDTLDLFDRDGVLVEVAPHWCWEAARSTVIPRARFSEYPDGIHIPSLEDVGGVIRDSV